MSIDRQTIEAAKQDLTFFSNAGRDQREVWVMEKWCSLTGKRIAQFTKSESPDFVGTNDHVEITEVVQPGRKRHQEYKRMLKSVSQGNIPRVKESSALEVVRQNAHLWIQEAASTKAGKYGSTANEWTLLLYLKFPFFEQINWDKAKVSTINISPFKVIEAISADGKQLRRLKP